MNNQWRKDPKARTLSYFAKEAPVHVDAKVLSELIQLYENNGRESVRLCLHSSTEKPHHDMIVLLPRGKEVHPHAHPHKEETLHIMKGTLGLIHYDENGEITDSFKLEPGDLFRVPAGFFHWTLPLSEYVIFHETAPGPYHPETGLLRAPWAPDPSDLEECERWLTRAFHLFEERK